MVGSKIMRMASMAGAAMLALGVPAGSAWGQSVEVVGENESVHAGQLEVPLNKS